MHGIPLTAAAFAPYQVQGVRKEKSVVGDRDLNAKVFLC